MEVGESVWVKCSSGNSASFWQPATVVGKFSDEEGECVEVLKESPVQRLRLRIPGEEHRILPRYRGASQYPEVNDLSCLPVVNEAELLHTLRLRYECGRYYTLLGPLLVTVLPPPRLVSSIAPCDDVALNLFAQPLLQNARGGATQCVILTGESGSGKTKIMQDLLKLMEVDGGGEVVGEVVRATNIVEIILGARTLLTNTSSRHVKVVTLSISREGKVFAPKVEVCLIDTVRVVHPPQGELNYHFFYLLVSACGDHPQWLLDSQSSFRYLHGSGPQVKDEFNVYRGGDLDQFSSLLQEVAGLSTGEVHHLYSIGVSVLFLGNLSFSLGDEEAPGEQPVRIEATPLIMQHLCNLLGLSEEILTAYLTTRKLSGPRGESYTKYHSITQASTARDALAKCLYLKIVRYLLHRTNSRFLKAFPLPPTPAVLVGSPTATGGAFLGRLSFLDTCGFTSATEGVPGSFETLCLNYSDDALQAHFLRTLLAKEVELYVSEGLTLEDMGLSEVSQKWEDQSNAALLLASQLFVAIDDAAKLAATLSSSTPSASTTSYPAIPNGDGEALAYTLYTLSNGGTSNEGASVESGGASSYVAGQFIVRHFGGPVVYNAEGWLDRNRDGLYRAAAEELLRCNAGSDDMIGRDYSTSISLSTFRAHASSTANSTMPSLGQKQKSILRGSSVGLAFKREVDSLLDFIDQTGSSSTHSTEDCPRTLHYVKCLLPSSFARYCQSGYHLLSHTVTQECSAEEWENMMLIDPVLLGDQVRANNLLDSLLVFETGYARRMSPEAFYNRFSAPFLAYMPHGLPKPQEVADWPRDGQTLLKHLRSYEFRSTTPWKRGVFQVSSSFRSSASSYLVDNEEVVQGRTVILLRESAYQMLIKASQSCCDLALETVRSILRRYLSRRRWYFLRKAILTVQCAIRVYRARQMLQRFRRHSAARVIRRYYLFYMFRLRLKAILVEARRQRAALSIQTAYRMRIARQIVARLRFWRMHARAVVVVGRFLRWWIVRRRFQVRVARVRLVCAEAVDKALSARDLTVGVGGGFYQEMHRQAGYYSRLDTILLREIYRLLAEKKSGYDEVNTLTVDVEAIRSRLQIYAAYFATTPSAEAPQADQSNHSSHQYNSSNSSIMEGGSPSRPRQINGGAHYIPKQSRFRFLVHYRLNDLSASIAAGYQMLLPDRIRWSGHSLRYFTSAEARIKAVEQSLTTEHRIFQRILRVMADIRDLLTLLTNSSPRSINRISGRFNLFGGSPSRHAGMSETKHNMSSSSSEVQQQLAEASLSLSRCLINDAGEEGEGEAQHKEEEAEVVEEVRQLLRLLHRYYQLYVEATVREYGPHSPFYQACCREQDEGRHAASVISATSAWHTTLKHYLTSLKAVLDSGRPLLPVEVQQDALKMLDVSWKLSSSGFPCFFDHDMLRRYLPPPAAAAAASEAANEEGNSEGVVRHNCVFRLVEEGVGCPGLSYMVDTAASLMLLLLQHFSSTASRHSNKRVKPSPLSLFPVRLLRLSGRSVQTAGRQAYYSAALHYSTHRLHDLLHPRQVPIPPAVPLPATSTLAVGNASSKPRDNGSGRQPTPPATRTANSGTAAPSGGGSSSGLRTSRRLQLPFPHRNSIRLEEKGSGGGGGNVESNGGSKLVAGAGEGHKRGPQSLSYSALSASQPLPPPPLSSRPLPPVPPPPPPPRPAVMTPPQLPTSDVRRHGSDNKLLRAQEAFLAQFLAHLLLGLRSATTTSLQTRRTLWFEAEGSGYGSNDEIEEEQDEENEWGVAGTSVSLPMAIAMLSSSVEEEEQAEGQDKNFNVLYTSPWMSKPLPHSFVTALCSPQSSSSSSSSSNNETSTSLLLHLWLASLLRECYLQGRRYDEMVAQGPEEGFDNRDLTALYLPLTLPQGCIPAIVQRHHKMLKTLHASQLEKREITPFDLLQAVSPTAYDQHYRVYREHYLRSTAAEEVPRGKMWKEWCKTLRALPPPPPRVATPTALTAMHSAYRLRYTNSVEKASEDLLRACMDWSSAGLANARADEIAYLIDSLAYMHTLPLLNASEEVLAIAFGDLLAPCSGLSSTAPKNAETMNVLTTPVKATSPEKVRGEDSLLSIDTFWEPGAVTGGRRAFVHCLLLLFDDAERAEEMEGSAIVHALRTRLKPRVRVLIATTASC